jgi:hypothetical protein
MFVIIAVHLVINVLLIVVQLSLLVGWAARWSWFWYYYNQARTINPAAVPDASIAPTTAIFFDDRSHKIHVGHPPSQDSLGSP